VYTIATQDASGFHDARIERWNPATGARTLVKALEPATSLGGYFIRVDGSAVIVGRPIGQWELTELSSGRTSTVPLMPGEEIIASVVLR
jgi:hypothetical protein